MTRSDRWRGLPFAVQVGACYGFFRTDKGNEMGARIQIAFTLPAQFRKRGRWHVASCPVLDVVSQGETAARARENLVNALVEFFLSCWERGTIDEVLKQAGFVPAGVARASRRKRRADGESVTVPLPFVIAETLARHRVEAV